MSHAKEIPLHCTTLIALMKSAIRSQDPIPCSALDLCYRRGGYVTYTDLVKIATDTRQRLESYDLNKWYSGVHMHPTSSNNDRHYKLRKSVQFLVSTFLLFFLVNILQKTIRMILLTLSVANPDQSFFLILKIVFFSFPWILLPLFLIWMTWRGNTKGIMISLFVVIVGILMGLL